jgi:hypothetical protein
MGHLRPAGPGALGVAGGGGISGGMNRRIRVQGDPEKTLNPNASTFTFHPSASVFVPSFSPYPRPLLDLGGAFAKPLPPAQQ